MHGACQVFRCFQFPFDERLIDHHFGSNICEFTLLPSLHLLAHGLEIALRSIDPNGNTIDQ